jgi:sugar phosphate isomerase/epimerase/sugar lactone lactonase YvrE
MKNKSVLIACYIALAIPIYGGQQSAPASESLRPLYVYNFGRLTERTPAEQIALLDQLGYVGITLSGEASKISMLDDYLQAVEDSDGSVRIASIFVRYNFKDPAADRALWQGVLDRIAGKGIDLWFIFGRRIDGITDADVEQALADVADAAAEQGVNVVLYPHSKCYIESAEEALPYVQRLARPNLGLAVHLYHESRAGNLDRVEDVLRTVAPYLKAVTLAGTDAVVDFSTPLAMDQSTIQPLDQGDYDLARFVHALDAIDYRGPVGLMNFKIEEEPADYLNRSIEIWSELNLVKDLTAFDAPDQAVWHAPSRTWFVSNLGGGISLKRDGYGWITRLDASGAVLTARWLEGFDAPSGMVTTDETLYVCDRDGLIEVDIASGSVRKKHLLPEGKFINDVARASNGDLYVSDFSANRIYQISKGGKPEVFIDDPRLDTPDGLLMVGNNLIVATWGPITNSATFETSRLGTMLSVDLNTKKIRPYKGEGEIGNLEGLTHVDGTIYVTDWMRGALMRETATGWEDVLTGLKNPTDPGYAPELGIIAVPEHTGNRVLFLRVHPPCNPTQNRSVIPMNPE